MELIESVPVMRLNESPVPEWLTYVFDLDGVIYRGNEPQPHAARVIGTLRDRGHKVRFFTNNSALTRESYAQKLQSMGIPAAADEIMTSAYATALYLREQNAAGCTVYQIGEEGITRELEAAGLRVITNCAEEGSEVDYVVVGIDRGFNYCKLARAQRAILNGARFIATNEDATYPIEGGEVLPGGGSLVAAVRTATSVEPIVLGKPETYALVKLLELAKTPADRAVIVGDRLDTDILVGNRAGAHTVLVLTGVTTREQAESAEGELKPERIIETLAELIE